MTEKEAKKQGLWFTGIYESCYSSYSVKQRAADIRKTYHCRAVLVYEENGVSVYADKKYFEVKELIDREAMARTFESRKLNLYKKYMEELQKLEEEERINCEKITQLKAKYDNID